MHIQNSVVLVTGANRGLGQAFVNALLQAGAAKIYAAARDPKTITLKGVVPIQLDITSEADIAAAAAQCTDITVLINNAGISHNKAFTDAGSAAATRAELETNFFGPLNLSLAFVPILKANGGGAIVNVLSVLSWLNIRSAATYSASKSAAWSLTNGLRGELKSQGTQVVGVHVGFMDTDMASGVDMPKTDPLDVARQTLVAVAEGKDEVLADDLSRQVKKGLSSGAYLAQVG